MKQNCVYGASLNEKNLNLAYSNKHIRVLQFENCIRPGEKLSTLLSAISNFDGYT